MLKVVELVDPLITVGQSQYYKAHDALVVGGGLGGQQLHVVLQQE